MKPSPRLPEMGDTFELWVRLRDIEPEIWRRLSVPAELPLGVLHEIIQLAFGWQNSHLHDFHVGNIRFGMADVEDEIFTVDEFAAPLGAVANVGTSFLYRYDFGDDWEHDVTVEGVSAGTDEGFACTGGARACPPEDCGGPPGYANLLEILADPSHPEQRETKKWAGRRFDPEKFDVTAVNRKLGTLSKRLRRLEREVSPKRPRRG
jgi:Plasmid pRiA4b ORF-3-like protein